MWGRRAAAALVAALATLLLLSAAPAGAFTSDDLARYQALADQTWPGRCVGRARARVVDQIPDDPADSERGLRTIGLATGMQTGGCDFELTRDLSTYQACVVTVHERGHLEGLGHIPGSIMDAQAVDLYANWRYAPCKLATPPVLSRDAALNWVDQRWPMYTLDCRRQTRSRQRCWGTSTHGHRLTFVVWRDAQQHVRGARLG